MTSPVFDADVYAKTSEAYVLGRAPSTSEAVGPRHAKTEVWMNYRAVRATVAGIATVVVVCVTPPIMGSRLVIDRDAVRAETSVDDDTPSWMTTVKDRITEYLSLSSGWDSYGAPPVTREAVNRIVDVLESLATSDTPTPSVAPTPEGGVQVEWHERGVDLELRSDSDGRLYAFFQDAADVELAWDDEVTDPAIAAPWFEHLASDEA